MTKKQITIKPDDEIYPLLLTEDIEGETKDILRIELKAGGIAWYYLGVLFPLDSLDTVVTGVENWLLQHRAPNTGSVLSSLYALERLSKKRGVIED